MNIPRLKATEPLSADFRCAVIALGNFDGFHRGHQAVASAAIAIAHAENRPAIIATFDPHPARHFVPNAPPFRLTTLDQRQRLFAAAGADAMLVFEFGVELANTSAEDFAITLLAGRLGAHHIVTGDDFTFGKARGGNVERLRDWGAAHDMGVTTIGPVSDNDGVISSSRIRGALSIGDVPTANALLTRPFAIEGIVQHGDKNGRKLGFPTANIDLGSYLRPRYGIYAVRGRLPNGQILDGAANLGIRPQFDPPKELLEPHFFDFNGDLYGQIIEIELHAYLRGEAKFENIDALMVQMQADCAQAKAYLRTID